MKTIEVSEDALESVKTMALKLQEERDMLLAALKPFLDGNFTIFGGKVIGIDARLTADDVKFARNAIAKVEQG